MSRSTAGRATAGKQARTPQAKASTGPSKARDAGSRAVGPSAGKPRPTANTSGTDAVQLAPSVFSRPAPQCTPQQVLASLQGRQVQQQRGIVQQPTHSNTIKIGSATSGVTRHIVPKPYSFPGVDQRIQYLQWMQQHGHQPDVRPLGQTSMIAGAVAPASAHPLVIAASTSGIPHLPYTITSSATGPYGTPAQAAFRSQQYNLLRKEPKLPSQANRASGSSLASLSSCRGSPACASPVFTAVASHGRAAVAEFSLLPSSPTRSVTGSQRSNSTLQDGAPLACCGLPLQPVSISQLFSGEAKRQAVAKFGLRHQPLVSHEACFLIHLRMSRNWVAWP